MHDWRLFALGSASFAALTAIFAKAGVTQMNSNLATLIRTAVVLLLCVAVVWARNEWQHPEGLAVRGVLYLGLSGAATGLSWLCYFRALQLAPASQVTPIDKLSVVLVVLFSVIFLNEPMTWKVALGTALISSGVLVLAL